MQVHIPAKLWSSLTDLGLVIITQPNLPCRITARIKWVWSLDLWKEEYKYDKQKTTALWRCYSGILTCQLFRECDLYAHCSCNIWIRKLHDFSVWVELPFAQIRTLNMNGKKSTWKIYVGQFTLQGNNRNWVNGRYSCGLNTQSCRPQLSHEQHSGTTPTGELNCWEKVSHMISYGLLIHDG